MGKHDVDRPIDAAIETATERTRDAQEEFVETPAESGRLGTAAETVERRAEDLLELASDDEALDS